MRYEGVFSFKIHVFISWFYHGNGCKFFAKIMSNSTVRNFVWNTAYIAVKLAMELPEVIRRDWKVYWYLEMGAFLDEELSKLRRIWALIVIKVSVNSDTLKSRNWRHSFSFYECFMLALLAMLLRNAPRLRFLTKIIMAMSNERFFHQFLLNLIIRG